MAISILILALILLLILFSDKGIRWAFIYSLIIIGTYSYLITEFLSLFSLLTFIGILTLWTGLCLGLTFLIFKKKPANILKFTYDFSNWKSQFLTFVLILLISVVSGVSFWICVKSPPNNFDSMTYHLSRVEHWIQDKNVYHYPTSNLRQLYTSPLAEILILQTRLLSTNDKYVNLIQWFSMIGCLVVVSLLTKQFGLRSYWQAIAACFAVTIPMGILQSNSTQNDYVVSFWIACSVLFIVKIIQKKSSILDCIFLGLSVGLALLTKQTSLFFLLPFGILLALHYMKNSSHIHQILTIGFITILLSIPHFSRNVLLFHNPTGPAYEISRHNVDSFLPNVLISNSIKNLSVHLGTNNVPLNNFFYQEIVKLHHYLGVDINDPRTSWEGTMKLEIIRTSTSENYAGNPIHFLIIFLLTAIFLLISIFPAKVFNQWHKFKNTLLGYPVNIVIGNSLHIQSSLVLKYLMAGWIGLIILSMYVLANAWISRLQLPFFILMSPIAVIILSRWNKLLSLVIIVLLFYQTLPYLTLNTDRSLIGPNSILYHNRDQITFLNFSPRAANIFNQFTDYIVSHNYRNIGLCTSGNFWEYPFWYKLRERYQNESFRFDYVQVQNESGLIKNDFQPQVVISVECEDPNYLKSDPKIKLESFELHVL